VEQLVVDPIEQALDGLDSVAQIRSTSQDGVGVVDVEFSYDVDPERKYDEVVREVNALRGTLPDGLARLEIRRARTTEVAIVQVALVSDTLPMRRLEKAADRLREKLAATAILAPRIPVVNNIDVAVESDPDRIRDALYRQAFGPVRWVECVRAIQARGIDTLVECGPGKVLAGMTKRIDAALTGLSVLDPATLADVKGQLA
jgi:hypothetical protein